MHQQSFSLRELAFGTLFVFVGLALIFSAVYHLLTTAINKTWPVARGEVISTNIIKEPPSSDCPSGCFMPIITYRYTLSGIEYPCKEIFPVTSSETKVNNIQKKFVVGSYVNVNYYPKRPQLCVSGYNQISAGSLLGFLLGLLFFALGLFLAWDSMLTLARKLINNINRRISHH